MLAAARTAAASVTEWIASTMGDLARGLIATINRHDQEGRTLAEIRAALAAGRAPMLAKVARFAGDAAHTTVVVGRDAAAGAMAGAEPDDMPARAQVLDVRRQWRSRRDARVRMTHRRADGQEVGPTVPFLVGGSLLRYPRDPAGPLRETAGCRCTVDYFLTDGVDLLPMRPAVSNA